MVQRLAIVIAVLYLIAGCQFLPVVEHQPTFHNPFPQLSRVGVAPFFNQTPEGAQPDGRQVALAYFNELQAIPGFEVAPPSVIELKAKQMGLPLSSSEDYRKVARALGLDAIVVGTITDFTPYYPPRMALQVDWYATNPGFHPIPTGYGLPWGTPAEEEIPQTLVEATEFELAREQLQTQSPEYIEEQLSPIPNAKRDVPYNVLSMVPKNKAPQLLDPRVPKDKQSPHEEPVKIQITPDQDQTASEKAATKPASAVQDAEAAESKNRLTLAQYHAAAAGQLPATWPDPSGFIPAPPSAVKPPLRPSIRPVLTHTRNYNGNDSDFTRSLENYAAFRDDARFGGWQGYLTRSDDFIRFCCHMHLTEMLTARGGASETRVVWHWPVRR
jgi:hypothetical protein